MIRMIDGTTFITAEAFLDRYRHSMPGYSFSYATGDLAGLCEYNEEAHELHDLVWAMNDQRKIALTERGRPDLVANGLPVAFEFVATKRKEAME